MKRYILILAFLVLLLIAACANSDNAEEATAGPTATSKPAAVSGTTGSFFAINEVGLGPDGWVSLTNFTDVTISTAGLYLCQGSDCFALPETEVPAHETVRVAVGDGSGLEGVIATGATFGELRPPDGEIALYDSERTDDPKSMLIYYQWGFTPHDLTDIAMEAGLWTEGGWGPTGDNATRLFRDEGSGLWLWE